MSVEVSSHAYAEHHPLVSGTDEVERISPRTVLDLERLVDALRDVRALLVNGDENATRLGVEAELRTVVADLIHDTAHYGVDVHICVGTNLATDDDLTRGGERLDAAAHVAGIGLRARARHEALRGQLSLARDNRIEYGVRDGVAHLVGVTLGHRLGSEQVLALRHVSSFVTPLSWGRRLRQRGIKKAPAWVRQGLRLATRCRARDALPSSSRHYQPAET